MRVYSTCAKVYPFIKWKGRKIEVFKRSQLYLTGSYAWAMGYFSYRALRGSVKLQVLSQRQGVRQGWAWTAQAMWFLPWSQKVGSKFTKSPSVLCYIKWEGTLGTHNGKVLLASFFLMDHLCCKILDLPIHRANVDWLSLCARLCSKHLCVRIKRNSV